MGELRCIIVRMRYTDKRPHRQHATLLALLAKCLAVLIQHPPGAAVAPRQRWGHRKAGDVQGILLQAAS